MKVVINRSIKGFSLSPSAKARLVVLGVESIEDLDRNDPRLVACVEQLGSAANGPGANLIVVEIPDNIDWDIHNVCGIERVFEVTRTWC